MEEVQNRFSGAQGELGLLDVLVTLAENVKLLVFGSLFVGVCALGIGYLLPKNYQSVAVIQAEQATASLMVTAAVLDPVSASLGLVKDGPVESARIKLQDQIKTAVGRNDKLLTLTVSADTPQQSQSLATAVLQQTFKESRPKGSVRSRLETQLAEAKVRLENAQNASKGVFKRLELSGTGVNGGVELARGYAELLNATGTAQTQISALETQLEGVSEAQVIQPPTLPQNPSRTKKGLLAIGATLATGFALLLFIFMRQAWRDGMKSEKSSAKLLCVRKSVGLR